MGASPNALLAFSTFTQGAAGLGSSFIEAANQRAQADFEKSMAELNAEFADAQALDASRRGKIRAHELNRKAKKLIGSQRAQLAAQGIDPDTGSAADIIGETRQISEFDQATIEANAAREAFGFKSKAISAQTSGRFGELAAERKARSTLLTGGLSFIRQSTNAEFQRRGLR